MSEQSFKPAEQYDFWTDAAIAAFCRSAAPFSYKKGENILTPLDENQSIYFVESGVVNMRYYAKDGNAVTVLKRVSGDIFGLKGIFDSKSEKNFYVVAATEVKCWKLSRIDFLNLINDNHEFGRCMLHWFITYVGAIEKKTLDSAVLNTYQKLIVNLIESAEDVKDNTGVVRITQQEIGNMISATRQTISAYLTLLEENGLVEVKRGSIILKNIDALKNELL